MIGSAVPDGKVTCDEQRQRHSERQPATPPARSSTRSRRTSASIPAPIRRSATSSPTAFRAATSSRARSASPRSPRPPARWRSIRRAQGLAHGPGGSAQRSSRRRIALPLRGDRGQGRAEPRGRKRLRRRRPDPLGRPGAARRAGFRSDEAERRRRRSKQFGYNNDFLGYFPMPGAANPSAHGLLVVNHEYTNEELMFPGIGRQDAAQRRVRQDDAGARRDRDGGARRRRDRGPPRRTASGRWCRTRNTRAASMPTTPMEITGPAAGHARMQTKDDPAGKRVLGMLNNCAGGITPWGTWLTCEENFHGYFWGKLDEQHAGGAQPQALRRSRQLDDTGATTPTASTSPRSRTSPTASAGSSRSIRSIPPRRRRSAPRSAASSTRARPASSTRTAATSSIPATTSASTMSIASSPTARVDTANRDGQRATSSTAARCRSPATTPTAR